MTDFQEAVVWLSTMFSALIAAFFISRSGHKRFSIFVLMSTLGWMLGFLVAPVARSRSIVGAAVGAVLGFIIAYALRHRMEA